MSDATPKMPTQADIAERAYQIFERRNWEHGSDIADWTLAEQELHREFKDAIKAMNSHDTKPESLAKKKSA